MQDEPGGEDENARTEVRDKRAHRRHAGVEPGPDDARRGGERKVRHRRHLNRVRENLRDESRQEDGDECVVQHVSRACGEPRHSRTHEAENAGENERQQGDENEQVNRRRSVRDEEFATLSQDRVERLGNCEGPQHQQVEGPDDRVTR
jgi:hypothetical protein